MNIYTKNYHFFGVNLFFETNIKEHYDNFHRIYGYFEQNTNQPLQTNHINKGIPIAKNQIQSDSNIEISETDLQNTNYNKADTDRIQLVNCSIKKINDLYSVKAKSKRYTLEYETKQPLNTDTYLSLFSPVLYEVKDYFLIHAGSLLSEQNKSLIISAPCGFGKTTNTRELCKKGFKLLSDELAPINLETGLIHPYPRGMGVLTEMTKKIEDIPRNTIGVKCYPSYIVFLTLEKKPEEQKERFIEVALGRITDEIISAFKNIKGVKETYIVTDRLFPMIRIALEENAHVVTQIQEICQKNFVPILYTLKGKTRPPDFNANPKLTEISAKEGVFELSQHILNAHDSALLEEKFSGSRPKMIFELAGLIGKARFFTLTVGKLNQMTQLLLDVCTIKN